MTHAAEADLRRLCALAGARPLDPAGDAAADAMAAHIYRRAYNLPDQLARTRAKLARLEAEARALGMHDLVNA